MQGREAYKVWREIATRWADNDAYGHVNNTIYYAWFDTAVNAWLIEAGLLDIAAGDPIGLVVETGCRYAARSLIPSRSRSARRGAARHFSVTYRLGVSPRARAKRRRKAFHHVYVGRKAGGRRRCPRRGARSSRRSA